MVKLSLVLLHVVANIRCSNWLLLGSLASMRRHRDCLFINHHISIVLRYNSLHLVLLRFLRRLNQLRLLSLIVQIFILFSTQIWLIRLGLLGEKRLRCGRFACLLCLLRQSTLWVRWWAFLHCCWPGLIHFLWLFKACWWWFLNSSRWLFCSIWLLSILSLITILTARVTWLQAKVVTSWSRWHLRSLFLIDTFYLSILLVLFNLLLLLLLRRYWLFNDVRLSWDRLRFLYVGEVINQIVVHKLVIIIHQVVFVE